MKKRSLVTLRHEQPNLTASATVATLQSALRSAEAGDTMQLFTLYRDIACSGSHILAELSKRILAVISEPISVHPAEKDNADDEKAALAVKRMIKDCENWNAGLTHLLSATLWPVAVVEKIFRPVEPMENTGDVKLRYTLKCLEPVNPLVLCFKHGMQFSAATTPGFIMGEWEPDLRFYFTDETGRIDYNWVKSEPADPLRHIIHRGHLLTSQRDNWGGPMRAAMFWWLLSALGRDWFGRGMERWGVPFPVGKTDASNTDSVTFLQDAFSLSTKIGGLVVDHETSVELQEIAASGMADAHEKFIGVCNREISKVILGNTLSGEAQPTGLGSGTAKLHGEVREDYKRYDIATLGTGTLPRQLFKQFLSINGLRGSVTATWGSVSPEEIAAIADLMAKLSSASLEPTDEAIAVISDRVGFEVQRKEMAPVVPPSPGGEGRGEGGPPIKPMSVGHLQLFTANGLGVPPSWLAPLRTLFADIEAKVKDETLSDADLLKFLDVAVKRVPELFGAMDVDALAEVFEAGMGDAVIDGVRAGLKKLKRT